MAQKSSPSGRRNDPPSGEPVLGDPWVAFSYLVAGVLLYGLIGLLLDHWWGTSFMVVVGIVVGAAFGVLQTWLRFRALELRQSRPPDPDQH
jgi:ATP synthase protein I